MYVLKQIPDDFIVEEVIDLKFDDAGEFTYIKLEKKNYTLQKALQTLSDALGIASKRITYAGTKDRKAITRQVICIDHMSKERIETISLKDIKLTYLGKGTQKISLGDLKENKFTITIRNIDSLPKHQDWFINYFDEQRFGNACTNHHVGKLLLQNKFKEALALLLGTKSIDYKQLLLEKTDHLDKRILNYLVKNPTNIVGAFKHLPKKILLLYLHAYQSYLWNLLVSDVLQEQEHRTLSTLFNELVIPHKKPDSMQITLPGFDDDSNEIIANKSNELIKSEGLIKRNFILRQFDGVILEGDKRDVVKPIYNLMIDSLEEDELNPSKKKCRITFSLDKGSYATMVVRHLMI